MNTHAHTVALSPALRQLLLAMQTWCQPHCCHADAFQISEGAIIRWLAGERTDRTRELAEEIARVATDLQHLEGRVALVARGLESEWDGAALRTFWQSLAAAFTSAVIKRSLAEPSGN